MNLAQLCERLGEGKYLTDIVIIKCNDKDYEIDHVYMEDFSDGLYQAVIELKEI